LIVSTGILLFAAMDGLLLKYTFSLAVKLLENFPDMFHCFQEL